MAAGAPRSYLAAVGSAFLYTLKQNVLDGFILFTILIQPLVVAVLGLWMLQPRGGDYAIYVVVGSGMTGLWGGTLFICGNSITAERWTGTLEFLVGQPTPLEMVVFGKNLASVLQSLLSMTAAYVLASLLFGYPLRVAHPLLFAAALPLGMLSFVCLGLVLATIFIANPGVQGWQNAMEFPVYILGGFLFPAALLPGWTTPLSYALAPYWAARALHAAAGGSPVPAGAAARDVLFPLAMLLAVSAAYLLVARLLFRVVLRRTRADATIGLE